MGLRPRHTAEILTVGAGMLIPLLTLGVLLSTSTQARKWVLEGPALVQMRDALQTQVSHLEMDRSTKEIQVADANQRYSASESRLASMRKQLSTTDAQMRALTNRFNSLTRNYRLVASNLRTENKKLKTLNDTFERLNGAYATLKQSYAALQGQIDEQYKENRRLLDQNDTITKEVEQGKQDAARQKDDFDQTQAQYERDIDEKKGELDFLLAEVKSASSEAERARQSVIDVTQHLNIDVLNTRTHRIIFQWGDEVARQTVDPGLSQIGAQAALDSLLRQARINAIARGALPRSNGLPAAGIFPVQDADGHTVSTETQEAALVRQIAAAKESELLVAYSPINAFDGESVALAIQTYPNPIIYRAGQTIVETRVNGRASTAEILNQVTAFLQNDVNEKIKRDKMILVAGTREPAFQVSFAEILEIVQQIKGEDSTVRLIAQASGNTRAAGPLSLQFHIQ